MKKTFVLILMVLTMLVLSTTAIAAPLPILVEQTKLDGTTIDSTSTTKLDVKRDNTVEVRVKFHSTQDLKNVDLRAYISGYEYNDYSELGDLIHLGRMQTNVTYVKTLEITLPDDVDEADYKLRLAFANRNDDELKVSYDLKIDVPRHEIKVDDLILYPENEVKAGSALLATVRLDNQGQKSEDDIKVTVSIPKLGLSASTYIDNLNSQDEQDTEELYMRVPTCSEPGLYTVEVNVEYNKNDNAFFSSSIYLVADDTCVAESNLGLKTRVVAGNDLQTVSAGQGVIFPITVTNGENVAKSFTFGASGTNDWADLKVSPASTLVLESGETKSFYVLVSPDDNVQGLKSFTASVSSGLNQLEQFDFTLNVEESSSSSNFNSLKKALGVGVLVLVVLLIVLGLVIGFSKLNDDDEEGPNAKTYY